VNRILEPWLGSAMPAGRVAKIPWRNHSRVTTVQSTGLRYSNRWRRFVTIKSWLEPLWQDWERAAVESKLGAAIVGSNATVKAGLENLLGGTGADEVIVVTDTYEHVDRLQSYRRVADVARMIEVKPTVAVGA
jgi:alkanesulfonate monooxygenase SsuD/methylene tetrahydromethanopterin reductase-like flavin-dependent oxidoreductase (luciferase family)